MDVSDLKEAINTYESQLKQVDQALEISGENNAELLELKENLLEVISLTNESLLSLTKAAALQQLEANSSSSSQVEDDEYAAFQNALADDASLPEPTTSNSEAVATLEETVLTSDLDDIIGTCVRAPHSHSWGGYQYHNAAIIGLDADNERVRVMYCQPRHISMKICPYFLEGKCRYTETDCQLSHGHLIHIDELREYEEPSNAELSVADYCLAKFPDDDLWYKATIVDSHGEDFLQVMYDDYGETTHAVERCDVMPLDNQSDTSSSSSDDEVNNETTTSNHDDDGAEAPSYLWKPSVDETLASWETHTRGVGSRLMAAMGYKAGQGLGKESQGRVEPVPILKLPPGKSLDRIMQLKQRTGDQNMFDVMKKKKHHKFKSSASGAQRPTKPAEMFIYLNRSLGHGRKVDLTSYRKNAKGSTGSTAPSVISKHELTKKSDKSINIQMIKTEEELSRVEHEIVSIKQRLEVNTSRRDAGGIKHLTEKLYKAEKYLETLTHSHRELSRHKGQREGRKKLMVF